jgi:hypothetical protein
MHTVQQVLPAMKGERKFLLALLLSSLLVGLVILNNGLGEALTENAWDKIGLWGR